MRRSGDKGSPGQMDGHRPIAGEEEEAVRKLRAALQNPHGTNAENRGRVFSAWQSLRSVATSADVQSKSRRRHRKRSKLEDNALKKEKRKKKKKDNGEEWKLEDGNTNSPSAQSMREEDKMLHEAARLGQADRVRELICQGSRASSKDNSGYSALHWASLYGHVEVVRALLGSGAGDGKRIDRQNDAGNTALHLACLGHHAEVAALLQIYKPDEYRMNAYDQTPISLGLRDLVASVEKIRQMGNVQTMRAKSQREHLLSAALDWRLERDSEYASSNIMKESGTGSESGRGLQGVWEDYSRAYSEFLERFTAKSDNDADAVRTKNILTESSRLDAFPVDGIRFQDVPWPVTGLNVLARGLIPADRTLGTRTLLLAELGLDGADLRPLIQRERLRWHPDKFLQLFGHHLAVEDKTVILAGVQTVIQLLNSLANETKEAGE